MENKILKWILITLVIIGVFFVVNLVMMMLIVKSFTNSSSELSILMDYYQAIK